MEFTYTDIQFHHPFTAQLAGPTGSGKTVLLRELIGEWKRLIDFSKTGNPKTLQVIWAHGISQDIHNVPIKNVNIKYNEGFPSLDLIKQEKPHLVVIDDLMNELGGDKDVSNLFTRVSHHNNVSVVFIVQNAFHQDKQMRNISLNCHYTILMNNKRDRSQILTFARQQCPSSPKCFLQAFEDSVKNKYGYLLVDNHPETPDELSWRTKITRDLNGVLAPTVYTKEIEKCKLL